MPLSLRRTLTEWFDGKAPKNGASEGIRTLDTHVGNVMLYQAELRSLPLSDAKSRANAFDCKPCFLCGAA